MSEEKTLIFSLRKIQYLFVEKCFSSVFTARATTLNMRKIRKI